LYDEKLTAFKKQNEKSKDKDEEIKKLREENEKTMKAMQQSYEEQLAVASKQKLSEKEMINKKADKIPHLSNVNMDPSLSKTIKFILEGDKRKTIGIVGKSDISLKGNDIQDPHAYIHINESSNEYSIESVNNSKLLINGKQLTKPTALNHLDRLIIGSSSYYIFIDPNKVDSDDKYFNFNEMNDEVTKKEKEQLKKKAEKIPHLSNVNMDPLLSKKVKHFFETNGKKVIGLPDKSDIPMKGNDIHNPHAFITLNEAGKCLIEPANNDSKLLINGKQLTKSTVLNHLDRLIIGSSNYYLFIDPSKEVTTEDNKYFNFKEMNDEIKKENDSLAKKEQENYENLLKQMKESYEEKLAESKKKPISEKEIINKKAETIPHLTNLNIDPVLSRKIKILFETNGKKVIGSSETADINFKSKDILNTHGFITINNDSKKYTIEAVKDAKLLRNGKQLNAPVDLVHMDRLLFGSIHYYLFIDPSKLKQKDQDYKFETMNDEIKRENGISKLANKNLSGINLYYCIIMLILNVNLTLKMMLKINKIFLI
jgi:sporulation protein YlmC with PRC-barrel domain